MKQKILEIDNLHKCYGKAENETKALAGISFQVMEGEFLGIMGSSGSGKSTLLNCIARVIQPTSGKIFVDGTEILTLKGAKLAEYRGKKIGYLFQNFELLDNLTGQENILLPLSIQNISEKESKKRLQELSSYLEISDVLDKFPTQMSGGQKQRVAAARALILNPSIILADEPTGALDSKSARQLLGTFEYLNQSLNASIVMVTHDAFTASYAERIIFIKDGKVFNELIKGNDTRKQFFEKIIEVQTLLGGELGDVI